MTKRRNCQQQQLCEEGNTSGIAAPIAHASHASLKEAGGISTQFQRNKHYSNDRKVYTAASTGFCGVGRSAVIVEHISPPLTRVHIQPKPVNIPSINASEACFQSSTSNLQQSAPSSNLHQLQKS